MREQGRGRGESNCNNLHRHQAAAALSDFLISFLMKTVGSGSGISLGVRGPSLIGHI